MKKLLLTLVLLTVLGFLSGCVLPARPEPDYLTPLIRAAAAGDAEAGRDAAAARRAWQEKSRSTEPSIDFDELLLLARAIACEAGDDWRSEQLRLCAGEVLLNRVASPEFPNSLAEVVAAEPWAQREDFASLAPGEDCARAALALLQGRRLLDARVVYLSDRPCGGGVYATFCDRHYRLCYFCLTEHAELYEEEALS